MYIVLCRYYVDIMYYIYYVISENVNICEY